MSHEKNPNIPITTLLDVVMSGQIDTLKKVLAECAQRKLKIDLNEQDDFGNFLTILAAQLNNLSLLRLLVDHGAASSLSLDFKDGRGRTVMGWAKKHNNVDMIAYIEKVLADLPSDKFENAVFPKPLSAELLAKSPVVKSPIKGH
ncbi:MAG: hypothetical protein SFW07_05680 [Gammaproteobacteria bacterium]|nr:hypothetical protein [Gammaproteobacteria bacterium]